MVNAVFSLIKPSILIERGPAATSKWWPCGINFYKKAFQSYSLFSKPELSWNLTTWKEVSRETWVLYLSIVLCNNCFPNIFSIRVGTVVVKDFKLICRFICSFISCSFTGYMLWQVFNVLYIKGISVQMISQGASKVSHLYYGFPCMPYFQYVPCMELYSFGTRE